MKEKNKSKPVPDKDDSKHEKNLDGYPLYPESDDIFNKYKEEKEIDPEDVSTIKIVPDRKTKRNEKDFSDDVTGKDLDVPGSELDDQQEDIGNEDEENNYYSLGGDDHNDLEEDKGE